jgi:hypothetical protein
MLKVYIGGGEEFLYDVEQGKNELSGKFTVVPGKGSKVKTLAPVDVEKVKSIRECVDKIVTEARLQQGIDHLKMNHLDITPLNLGEFIKWVVGDATREELDTILESGLVVKEVGKAASTVARNWFLSKWESFSEF